MSSLVRTVIFCEFDASPSLSGQVINNSGKSHGIGTSSGKHFSASRTNRFSSCIMLCFVARLVSQEYGPQQNLVAGLDKLEQVTWCMRSGESLPCPIYVI